MGNIESSITAQFVKITGDSQHTIGVTTIYIWWLNHEVGWNNAYYLMQQCPVC